jgi:hypothetical protein
MRIFGEGGTGKSRLIEAIKAWFLIIHRRHELVITATTGTAAVKIGGTKDLPLVIHLGIVNSNFEHQINLCTQTSMYEYPTLLPPSLRDSTSNPTTSPTYDLVPRVPQAILHRLNIYSQVLRPEIEIVFEFQATLWSRSKPIIKR